MGSFPLHFGNIKKIQENIYYLTTHHGIKVGFVCKFIISELKLLIRQTLLDATYQLVFKSKLFETRDRQLEQIGQILYKSPECNLNALKAWRDKKYAI